ncbi:hypothetical protein J4Q44_G00338690 [Coregonus suidteri]|uniref:Cyclin N-terminal domain-containing protein n=1 Tax=Coregonus suidteri TaxID=861788 RepID=A0AAN8L0H6_9TELE
MAKTGLCDSMPLVDLHKKVAEERRAPLRDLANACGPKEHWKPQDGELRGTHQKTEPESRWARRLPLSTDDGIVMGFHEDDSPSHSDGCMEEEAVLLYLHGLQGLYSLQALVPGLLRLEMELAMETLGLIYDRSYAWDIFSDMMVTYPDLSDTTRAILVDWLIQVNEVFHFSEETLYLSVHLLNRCLHKIKLNTAKLQLLGVVSELCFLMENSYSKRQLLPPRWCGCLVTCWSSLCWRDSVCCSWLPTWLVLPSVWLVGYCRSPPPQRESAWCVAANIHIGSETTLLRIM